MAETKEPAGTTREAGDAAERKIDLQSLAERICRLLAEEARLERERLGRFQAQ
jgi:hypothetical protein